jgi:hypothetical protein
MSPTIQKTTEQVVASNFKIGVSIVSSSSIIKFKIWLIANAYIDVRRLIRNAKMHRVWRSASRRAIRKFYLS